MSLFRKHPLFASALTASAALVLGEGWCIYDRWAAARDAAVTFEQKKQQLHAMAGLVPAPTRAVATAIEADLGRAQQALETMRTELRGSGPAAERMRKATVPAARTDAFFDLATFVEKTRETARARQVELKPAAERFGFAAYANEGPEVERISAVFQQRLVAQYLVESLLDARPRALLSVQRERPLTKAEREARDAAAPGTTPPAADGSFSNAPDGPDYFAIDARASARVPGYVDAMAFKLAFTGQTAALRTFLNKLASFELPVLVREVEVAPATGEDAATVSPASEDATTAEPAPASVVLTVEAPASSGPPRAMASAPIVAKPLSKFTVTVEYIDLVPPPGGAAETAKPGA